MFYRVLYYHFFIIIALGCLLFIPHATSFEAPNLESVENFSPSSARLLTTCSSTCQNGGTCDAVTLRCVCKGSYLGADCAEQGTPLSNDDSVNSEISSKEWIYFYFTLDENKEVKISLDYTFYPIKAALLFSDSDYVLPPTSQESYAYMNSPDTRSWQITLSSSEVKRHCGQDLIIGLYNPNNQLNNIKIKVATSGSKTLTIILIIIGVLSVILNIVGCIYFIKYKMRRELLAALREQAAREERTNFSHNVHTHFGNIRIQNWSENGPNGGQNNPNQPHNVDLDASLTQEDLNMYFPQTKFESLKTPFGQAECPICLEEFPKDAICRQLYCEHIFHTRCIQFWLAKHKACPNCKKSMTRAAIGDYYAHHKKQDDQEEEKRAINEPEEGEENNVVIDIGQALANVENQPGNEPEEEKDNEVSKIFNEEEKIDIKEEYEEGEKRLEATHLEVVHLSADKKDNEPNILENKYE